MGIRHQCFTEMKVNKQLMSICVSYIPFGKKIGGKKNDWTLHGMLTMLKQYKFKVFKKRKYVSHEKVTAMLCDKIPVNEMSKIPFHSLCSLLFYPFHLVLYGTAFAITMNDSLLKMILLSGIFEKKAKKEQNWWKIQFAATSYKALFCLPHPTLNTYNTAYAHEYKCNGYVLKS